MPRPPENVEREVKCPNCGERRTTKAQPNTNLRCRNCGQLFKVPRPGAPSTDPAPHAITGEPAGVDQQAPSAGVPPKRVTPKIDPAPPPPPGVSDDGTDGGEEATTSPGHSGEEPGAADPPPEPAPEPDPEPPPEPAPEPAREKPRGAKRWRR